MREGTALRAPPFYPPSLFRSTLLLFSGLLAFSFLPVASPAQDAPPEAPPKSAQAADSYAADIAAAARRFDIPERWIRAVMHAESNGIARAVSPDGAIGLMQIMPKTWAALAARYHLGSDPFDPHDNILAGAAYLRELHDRYGSPGFLAAYNAGPGRYDQHLATGRQVPAETRAYVAALKPLIDGAETRPASPIKLVARGAWTRAPPLGEATSRLAWHEGWILGVLSDFKPNAKETNSKTSSPRRA